MDLVAMRPISTSAGGWGPRGHYLSLFNVRRRGCAVQLRGDAGVLKVLCFLELLQPLVGMQRRRGLRKGGEGRQGARSFGSW